MNLISPVLNGLKEDDDLMALSKLFQLFMQNEKKLFEVENFIFQIKLTKKL